MKRFCFIDVLFVFSFVLYLFIKNVKNVIVFASVLTYVFDWPIPLEKLLRRLT